jgi:hypothetical protein
MLEIRAGRDTDKGAILGLIKEVFGNEEAERAERRWHWQWHEDPRLGSPGYRGVVAEWNGQVIANLSCLSSGLHLQGEPVDAYWFADALAHWGSIRRAMREMKRAGVVEGGPDLSKGIAAAMLNHPAAGVAQLGKHLTDPMAVVAYKIGSTDQKDTGSWSRILSFRQPLENYIGKLWAGLLGWCADWVLPRLPPLKKEVRRLEGSFDERFDVLWEQVRREYPAITRRDRATLEWRYRKHPDTAYTVLIVEDHGELLGYLVYACFHRHQQHRAQIVDILAPCTHTDALNDLLSDAMQRMRRDGVHKVECYAGGKIMINALEGLGFKQRLHNGKPQSTLIRRLPDVELYVTRGDGDGG